MFGPWLEIFGWLRSLIPESLQWPKLNFLSLHYIYLISLSIIGSIILFPTRNLDYIDCLFFASGSATQSGLNPVNINDIFTYQQVTLMLIACIANPIFINTFVVFVRLYWFEKRFQHVVIEAAKLRSTRERSRTKGEVDTEKGIQPPHEMGVGNRNIVVMHPGAGTMETAHKIKSDSPDETTSDSASSHDQPNRPEADDAISPHSKTSNTMPFRRDITFADEIKPARTDSDPDPVPEARTAEDHIAFLEKQRNPNDNDVLYIPGPRDFDRGDVPQNVHYDDESPKLQKHRTDEPQWLSNSSSAGHEDNGSDDNEEAPPLRHRRRRMSSASDAPSALSRTKSDLFGRVKSLPKKFRKHDHDDESSHHGTAMEREETSPPGLRRRGRTATFASFMSSRTEERDPMPYLSYQPTIGRNSFFVNLTEEQREELGGIEYRALKLLATVLCCYFVGFQLFGLVCYLPWIEYSGTYQPILDSDGISYGWWGVFTPASMFNDLGFTLTPDSMSSFNYAVFILLIGSFLIIIGNTGFPCMLRFVIWVLSLVTPRSSALWEEFRFLLDHPRRCFTLLFPSTATWWLFWILVLLNGVDLLFFIILDLQDPTVTIFPPGIRVLNGWFQAASTRTAGFNVVNIANLHPAIQVSYLVMMYISVFPIAISVRRTNVYEERSLGVYAGDADDEAGKEQSYVGAHLRRQLSFDLWYVFLGVFIIAIVEGGRIQDPNEPAFTLFAVLFEVVSSYGTVGLSLGYPGIDASFSAEFAVISKLVIIAMQIRGRHRGLPYALDRAVLLPSESLQRREEEEAQRQARRRSSAIDGNMPADFSGSRRGTTMSTGSRRKRNGRLTELISSALSAGPTIGKRID